MTALREVELTCDANGPMSCTDTAPVYGPTAVDARRAARAAGWVTNRPGGRDYCPVHADAVCFDKDLSDAARYVDT